VESSHPYKADDEETGGEQPYTSTAEAFCQEGGTESYQNNAYTASGALTAQALQALETPLQAGDLALQSVNFALLHTSSLHATRVLPTIQGPPN